MNTPEFDFGMIGLGTMGRNLLLNIADQGFAGIGFDKDSSRLSLLQSSTIPGSKIKGAASISELVAALKPPRKIMLLVPAGPIVDTVINELLPFVETGDIIIDGGNSHYTDTARRIVVLNGKGLHFTGMGISGGEEGARKGPSIMPGGDKEAWSILKPLLESIAARVNDEPCVAYMGKGAAGHYVKMVHNGIEYAIMQLISEIYDILKRGLQLNNDQLYEVFNKWNEGELKSFLVEITASIFKQPDEFSNNRLVDMILDKAGSKGTGKWTSQEAMDLGVAVPTIDMAVAMRDLSTITDERKLAYALYKPNTKTWTGDRAKMIDLLHDALFAGMLLSYAQGFALLQKASVERQMEIPIVDVVRIWRGGCIIRSSQLELFATVFKKSPLLENILLDKKVATLIRKKQRGLRKAIQHAVVTKIPLAGLMSALSWFDAYSSSSLPTNLVQAQRDLFGSHTYQRVDKEGSFHTEWH